MTATTIEISLEREIERKIKKSITLYIDTFFSLSISYIPVVYESNLILQDRNEKRKIFKQGYIFDSSIFVFLVRSRIFH